MATLWKLTFLLAFASAAPAAEPAITFNRDIAPLVFQHCSTCHRPGQAGPFPLLTFNDVKKRAKQIAEVTSSRYMPPWLPEGAMGEFLGDRRLTESEARRFTLWFEAGAPEGVPAELPPQPKWVEGWQLGQPDLVASMPRRFVLPAEGRDVYRNFVIPVQLERPRYVRAVEFRPNNRRLVHHAFVKVDSSGQVQKLDGVDGQPGFDGMNPPDSVQMPNGYFLSYQPGKISTFEPPGFGWVLKPGQALVVQAHLRPTGKPEDLQAEVGLYFTDIPPTNITRVLSLSSLNIDIPAGTNRYLAADNLTLPVEVEVLAVLPHTHYLGKRLEGFAHLPDGETKNLLSIPKWDFNWQGDYRYAKQVRLPAGTVLEMRYLFDNSAANPNNPNQPPKEVFFGPQSSDEMAELWFQLKVSNPDDDARLARAFNQKNLLLLIRYDEFRLRRNPHDARARTELGFAQWSQGQVAEAEKSFQAAILDEPAYDQPHYYLGVVYRTQNQLTRARDEFETAIRLNPKNARAFGNLGLVCLGLGEVDKAERSLRQAAELDPTDVLARTALGQIQQARANPAPAH